MSNYYIPVLTCRNRPDPLQTHSDTMNSIPVLPQGPHYLDYTLIARHYTDRLDTVKTPSETPAKPHSSMLNLDQVLAASCQHAPITHTPESPKN